MKGQKFSPVALAGLLLAGAGTGLHLWFLFHLPLNSDQAVAGLMAKDVLDGHFRVFYPGQVYGGSAEEVVMAGVGAGLGFSALTVNGTVMALFALSALVVGRAARRLGADPALAVLAGAVFWACPLALVANGTYAYGFRAATMLCGVVIVLIALRISDGKLAPAEFAAFGLVAGVGWWSSPELAYFLLPAGLLVGRAVWCHRGAPGRPGPRLAGWAGRGGALVGAFLVGAAPWIWANSRSDLASMRTSSLPHPAGAPGYAGRLHLYFRYVLPMLFGLRHPWSGAWVIGSRLGPPLYALAGAVLVGVVVRAVLRRGPAAALAVGVVAFPFLLSVLPDSRNWESGRYGMYDWPLIVLAAAAAASPGGLARRRARPAGLHRRQDAPGRLGRLGRLVAVAVAAGLGALAVIGLHQTAQPPGTAWWSDPDGPSGPTVAALAADGVRYGYADYWVAYRLDLLSGGKLDLTVVGRDPQRDEAVERAVAASADPAWVFVPTSEAAVNQFAPTPAIDAPGGVTLAYLVAYLDRHAIAYRRRHAGLAEVVIPARPVTPADLGVTAAPVP